MEKRENKAKLTLVDYYNSLPSVSAPKTEFIKKVMDRCGVSQQAIHRWIKRGCMPSSKEHCDAVAEIVGISVEELFPLYNEKFVDHESN